MNRIFCPDKKFWVEFSSSFARYVFSGNRGSGLCAR
jgi:hypothetical protein